MATMLIAGTTGHSQKDSTITRKDRKRDVLLETNFGDIIIRLSDSTPLHRDNFLKLVKTGFYDSILFHRVIQHFMIQAGDPDSRRAGPGQPLGGGDLLTEFLLSSGQHCSISGERSQRRATTIPKRRAVAVNFILCKAKYFPTQD